MDGFALAVALVSFAWMAFQIERMRLQESHVEQPATPGSASFQVGSPRPPDEMRQTIANF